MTKVTVLRTLGPILAKRIKADGSVDPYGLAKRFHVEESNADNIEQLSVLLTKLEPETTCCIVRGGLDESVDTERPIQRRLKRHAGDGNDYPLIDIAQPWLMTDIDKLPLPEGMDVVISPLNAVQYAISQLPSEFHKVTAYWHLSGSAGLKDRHTISVHLYYWLEEPLTCYALKMWAKRYNEHRGEKLIDTALFNPAQIHYTANPVFDDVGMDPFLHKRSGTLTGAAKAVDVCLDAWKATEARSVSSGKPVGTFSFSGGFEAILEKLGDHHGGEGFNDVLCSATASFARKQGSKAEEYRESLKEDLKERIHAADQSRHTPAQIGRYLSDEYLDETISSAIEKFGASSGVTPYFDTKTVPVTEGEKLLSQALDDFKTAAIKHYADGLSHDAPVMAIRATAGLGKTAAVIEQLTSYSLLEHGDIHYFVPNHRLSVELAHKLSEELDLILDNGDIYRRHRVIRGRTQPDESGEPLCRKWELAKKVQQAGGSVARLLCGGGEDRCEYFDDCEYQQQFDHITEMKIEDTGKKTVFTDIKVFSHDHLFLPSRKDMPLPALVVIDESFIGTALESFQVSYPDLRRAGGAAVVIAEELLAGSQRVLGALRDKGLEPDDLIAEAAIVSGVNDLKKLRPGLPQREQDRLLSGYVKPNNVDKLLAAVADELRCVDREVSHVVTAGRDAAIVKQRRDTVGLADVPTLIIDADVNKELLSLFFADIDFRRIDVGRLAEVHQFKDQTFSKTKLLASDGELQSEITEFIKGLAKKGTTLVACTKAFRCALTGEPTGKTIPADAEFHGAKIIHFNNLRGLNVYEDFDNVIIIGREQPPAGAAEQDAMGLYWDAEPSVQMLEEKSGNRPLEKEIRGYRLTSGALESGISVQIHPDHRVQTVLELKRECESLQAIDRLRLLRPKETARKVFILCSLPLDIDVDYLWSWEELQRALKVIDEAGGIIPLNPEHLQVRCPSITSESTAKRTGRVLKRFTSLIYTIRDMTLLTANYSTASARQASTVLYSDKYSLEAVQQVLSDIAGEPITPTQSLLE